MCCPFSIDSHWNSVKIRVSDLHPFHADRDPDPGFEKFEDADMDPDPGCEKFADLDPDPSLLFFPIN